MMLSLQSRGCHNINFVTPTHYVPQILDAVEQAARAGLHIPLVYNSSGYELISTLGLLAGVIDIYMPDVKYGTREAAQKYSGAPEYFDVARDAVTEMHRQVGVLRVSRQGTAKRGLLVRHLVLPGGLAGSRDVLSFLKKSISPETYVSIMSQYFPAYKATELPELNRKVTDKEYEAVVLIAEKLGLIRGWRQPSPEP